MSKRTPVDMPVDDSIGNDPRPVEVVDAVKDLPNEPSRPVLENERGDRDGPFNPEGGNEARHNTQGEVTAKSTVEGRSGHTSFKDVREDALRRTEPVASRQRAAFHDPIELPTNVPSRPLVEFFVPAEFHQSNGLTLNSAHHEETLGILSRLAGNATTAGRSDLLRLGALLGHRGLTLAAQSTFDAPVVRTIDSGPQ